MAIVRDPPSAQAKALSHLHLAASKGNLDEVSRIIKTNILLDRPLVCTLVVFAMLHWDDINKIPLIQSLLKRLEQLPRTVPTERKEEYVVIDIAPESDHGKPLIELAQLKLQGEYKEIKSADVIDIVPEFDPDITRLLELATHLNQDALIKLFSEKVKSPENADCIPRNKLTPAQYALYRQATSAMKTLQTACARATESDCFAVLVYAFKQKNYIALVELQTALNTLPALINRAKKSGNAELAVFLSIAKKSKSKLEFSEIRKLISPYNVLHYLDEKSRAKFFSTSKEIRLGYKASWEKNYFGQEMKHLYAFLEQIDLEIKQAGWCGQREWNRWDLAAGVLSVAGLATLIFSSYWMHTQITLPQARLYNQMRRISAGLPAPNQDLTCYDFLGNGYAPGCDPIGNSSDNMIPVPQVCQAICAQLSSTDPLFWELIGGVVGGGISSLFSLLKIIDKLLRGAERYDNLRIDQFSQEAQALARQLFPKPEADAKEAKKPQKPNPLQGMSTASTLRQIRAAILERRQDLWKQDPCLPDLKKEEESQQMELHAELNRRPAPAAAAAAAVSLSSASSVRNSYGSINHDDTREEKQHAPSKRS